MTNLRPGRVIYFDDGQMGTNNKRSHPHDIFLAWRWRDVTPSSKARVRRLMAVMSHTDGERMWEYQPWHVLDKVSA